MIDTAGFLSRSDEKQIQYAVAAAECATTAEIKVVVLRWCWVLLHVKAMIEA